MCCTRLAGNTGRKKNSHFGTIAQLCQAISSELRHVLTIGKNLLNSNTSSTCPDNIVNFGLLTAETCWRVWGTPANFNGFRVLAALLHGTLAVGVSQTAALNRGRHLHSTGRPSRWALAHISSLDFFTIRCYTQNYITAATISKRIEYSLLLPYRVIELHKKLTVYMNHFIKVVCILSLKQ